jgi:serine/threonine protein phosphatase PrpC
MTLALRYAVRSDVGLLREGNEDSAYAGPRLLAVADGMGGHAAGEVASAVTIGAMAELDSDRYAGTDLLADLSNAVAAANMRLQQMIMANPAVEGMGTTLTAVLWFDGHAAVCHIGDSRGYLLRAGQLYQITHDHTLVQSLVDEGRITEDDVSTHPQRSLLLRALDGRTVAEPDLSVHEAQPGDRYLLCSDGLSGVVSDETLRDTLAGFPDPDGAARQLIDLAIRGGGPDNITCIVADVVELGPGSGPIPVQGPTLAGAAVHGTDPRAILASTNPFAAQTGLTGMTRSMPTPRAARTAPQPILTDDNAPVPNGDQPGGRRSHRRAAAPREGTRRRRRWPIVTSALVVLLVVIVVGGFFAWQYSQSQYYIAVDKSNQVVVYRGVNESIAGIALSHPYSQTGIMLDQVPAPYRSQLDSTINATSLADANATIADVKSKVTLCSNYWKDLAAWNLRENAYNTERSQAKTQAEKNKIQKPPPAPIEPAGLTCPSASFYQPSGSS